MIERAIKSIRRGTPPSREQEAERAIVLLREVQRILGGDIQTEPNKRPRYFSRHEESRLLNLGYVLISHTGQPIQSMYGGLSDSSRQILGNEYTATTPNRSIAFHPRFTEVVPADFIDRDGFHFHLIEHKLFADAQVKQGEGIGAPFLGSPRDYLETVITAMNPENWDLFSGRVLTRSGIMTFGIDEEHGAKTWSLGGDFSTPAKLIPLVQPKSS